jgi:hypothetical protein
VLTRSPAALLTAYADRFDRALSDGTHSIASPLGAWLLLALVAPAASGAERDALEAALGTRPKHAAAFAGDLLETPHPAVASALALWHRDEFVSSKFGKWARRLPSTTETGRVPTQAEADEWAARTTRGLIDRFPIELDADVAVVLANALATRIAWSTPFDVAPATALGGPWSTGIDNALSAVPVAHTMLIAQTETAGDVAVHAARSDNGLTVVSVIARPEIAPADVRTAALDAASLVVGADSTARARSLFDLATGDGPAWTIAERPRSGGGDREHYAAFLPSWTATSEHDLLALEPSLGLTAACRTLGRFVVADRPAFEAKQVATASYHRRGFEAAAITTSVMRLSASPGDVERHATLRFGHPYAVVAVATDDEGGPWHGVPVFSAWVAEPVESDPA